MTTLLEMTNFLELIICPTIFFCLDIGYLDSWASLSLSVYRPNMLIYFWGFSSFLLWLSIKEKDTKGADAGGPWLNSACIRGSSIKNTSTEGVCITNTCIRKVYIGVAYTGSISVIHTCIKDASTKKACIKSANNVCSKGASAKVSYTGGARGNSAIKGLGIYLQSFWISELRQYNIRFKTGIRIG